MKEHVFPSRQGLILGAALVALHGLREECATEAGHIGYTDFTQYTPYARVSDAFLALGELRPFETSNKRILERMAHTRETLHVSREEWEACVPLSAPSRRASNLPLPQIST